MTVESMRYTDGGFWAETHWVARCARCFTYGDFYPNAREKNRMGAEREARRLGLPPLFLVRTRKGDGMNLTEALWCERDFESHADEDSFHAQAVTHDGEMFSVMVWNDYEEAEAAWDTVNAYIAGRTRFMPERIPWQSPCTITLDQVREIAADWKARDIPHDDEWELAATSPDGLHWQLLVWHQGEGMETFHTAEEYYAGVGKYVRDASA